jgi:hypothetical protein
MRLRTTRVHEGRVVGAEAAMSSGPVLSLAKAVGVIITRP